jgi:predicted dehydrogenase
MSQVGARGLHEGGRSVTPIGVAVVGCGLVGERRAHTASADERTALRLVIDTDRARANALAGALGAQAGRDWREAMEREDVGVVVVSTPNALLVPIGIAALRAGRHVLIEKPMGRNATEARALAAAATRSGTVLKVGFNHRYHPGLTRAHEIVRSGEIGRIIQMRARYGHGARPGCEKEWRGDAELAGGGELMDQGVHIVDLFHWFAGPATRVQAELQTAVWELGRLEDNAFGLLRFGAGVVGQFHVSMTQWKNLFSLEIHAERGAVLIEGLGGSYGPQALTVLHRNMAGGVPQVARTQYDGPDPSWSLEWADFAAALHGNRLEHGWPEDALQVMSTIDALYAAARSGSAVSISPPSVAGATR